MADFIDQLGLSYSNPSNGQNLGEMTKSHQTLNLFQIFLSGFRGATLDKLRKIINIGGATRCNQINDNVTHVVIGDRINTDIEHIKTLGMRPHTVTINWLVECYKQEQHVEETSYYSSELPAPETSSSPQLKKYVN